MRTGRRKLYPKERVLSVRLSIKEYRFFERMALEARMTIGAYMKSALYNYDVRSGIRALKNLLAELMHNLNKYEKVVNDHYPQYQKQFKESQHATHKDRSRP